ncbi:MAG TPA: glycosyltransferase [Propionibacteriaceae bacterium]|nr:glycosyltransferase family 1 protein [Micropruina sp.]HBX82223.1 glycosyltransferase [Propionibacteriaceae bacterium]HBY22450.1 glycosyltransferase [Propionibacteriaceae bacterium]
MKVTLVSYGSDGDVRPMVALGEGLRAAGHEAVLVGDIGGAALAQAHDLEFHAFAGSVRDEMEGGFGGTMDAGRFTLRAIVEFRLPHAAWHTTIAKAARGSDAVLCLPLATYHAASAADEVGAVPILVNLQPMLPTREFAPSGLGVVGAPRVANHLIGRLVDAGGWGLYGGGLNKARRTLGLGRLRNPYSADPLLGAWSPTLVPLPSDWDAFRVTVTGDWPLPAASAWEPDADLRAFLESGEPPIYVGFGSMMGVAGLPAIVDAALAAFAGRRVLLHGGWAGVAARDLPTNVHALGFAPHDWLFPQCAAIVHHCGAGTTHTAARSGTPSIPVPLLLDQPFWADRLHRLGIASRPLNRRHPSVAAFADAFAEVDRPEVRARASEIAARMRREDGVAKAVAVIERLVSGRSSDG